MDDSCNQPCGRGHHKKKKKGLRSRFDRRKNDERRRQQANKENAGTVEHPVCTNPVPSLPKHWKKVSTSTSTQYCKLENTLDGICQVTASVVFSSERSWSVYVCGKKVPETCSLLKEFPRCISSLNVLSDLISAIDRAVRCSGNPDDNFVDLCQKRGGEMKSARGNGDVIAYIDNCTMIDSKGHSHPQTVRRVDCDIICKSTHSHHVRCKSCQSFRSSLRASLSRQRGKCDDPTAASSHTKYCYLTSSQKDERMRNLHQSLRLAKQQINRMEAKVKKLLNDQAVPLQDDDAADIVRLIADVSPVVKEKFAEDSPQKVFWEEQVKYNSLKDKRQMRWHPLIIRFALNLKYLSNSAYRGIRQSGVIALPSERTLADYTHWVTPHTGVQLEFIEEFKISMAEDVPDGLHQCTLSMDEMKIKSGLVFNKHTGALSGFTDLGDSNREIEQILSGDAEESSGGKLADQVFVFMARAVFKPSLSVPVAHYFSCNLKGMYMYIIKLNMHVASSNCIKFVPCLQESRSFLWRGKRWRH